MDCTDVVKQFKNRVLIIVEGGVVQDIIQDVPDTNQIVLLDFDTCDDHLKVVDTDGNTVSVGIFSEIELTGLDPGKRKSILDHYFGQLDG